MSDSPEKTAGFRAFLALDLLIADQTGGRAGEKKSPADRAWLEKSYEGGTPQTPGLPPGVYPSVRVLCQFEQNRKIEKLPNLKLGLGAEGYNHTNGWVGVEVAHG